MSLYIGNDNTGKALLHLTSSPNTREELKNNTTLPGTVFNSKTAYTTCTVFNALSFTKTYHATNTTNFSYIPSGCLNGYIITARFDASAISKIFNPERMLHIIDSSGTGTRYMNLALPNYYTNIDSLFTYYDSNMANPTTYITPSTRYIRYFSSADVSYVNLIVFNISSSGSKLGTIHNETSLRITGSEGIVFGSTSLISQGFLVTPPLNSVDTRINLGNTVYQVLNSREVNNGFSISTSNGINFYDGSKLIFSSNTAIMHAPLNNVLSISALGYSPAGNNRLFPTYTKSQVGSVRYARATLVPLASSIQFAYVFITFIDTKYGDYTLILEKDGPIVWFKYFYYYGSGHWCHGIQYSSAHGGIIFADTSSSLYTPYAIPECTIKVVS